MPTYVVTCRTCGHEFEPTRHAIATGSWRDCPVCSMAIIQGTTDPSPAEPPIPGPRVCPRCKKILKSGKHRGPCPGRPHRERPLRRPPCQL
jgi:hypothetical protein